MLKNLNSIRILCLVSLVSIGFFSSFNNFKGDPKGKIRTIVIDAGHGGKDPGCNGVTHKEKDVALAIALKLGKLIEENIKDVKVIYTRKTDIFVELEDRAKLANDNHADLFISIHCNAAGKPVMVRDKKTGKKRPKMYKNSRGKMVVVETTNPVPFGSETYVMGLKNEEGKMKVAQRENSVILLEDNYESKYQGFDPNSEESYIIMSNYTTGYVINSAGLALKIQDEYANKAGRVDKGVHRQSIWVLWRTAMPSVLTEVGYLTNPQEEKFLSSEKGQSYMASCLFRAFRKYKDEQEGDKKNYNDEIENQKPLEKEIYITPVDTSDEEKDIEPKIDSVKIEPKKIEPKKIVDSIPEKKEPIKEPIKEPVKEPIKENKEFDKNEIIKVYKSKKDTVIAKTPVIENKKSGIVFKVQFATNDKEVDSKTKYPNITDVSFYKMGAAYKYTSGSYNSFDEATKQQSKLKEIGFKDCFVVAFKDGQRIDIAEARKQTQPK